MNLRKLMFRPLRKNAAVERMHQLMSARLDGLTDQIHTALQTVAQTAADEVRRCGKADLSRMLKDDGSDGQTAGRTVDQLTAIQLLDALDMGGFDAVVQVVTTEAQTVFSDSAAEGVEAVGATATTDITNQLDDEAVQWARAHGAELVGKRVLPDGSIIDNPDTRWNILESTREAIKQLVAQAVTEGWSTNELAKNVMADAAFAKTRAQTIARTELAFAHTQGNVAGWKASGLKVQKLSVLGSEHDRDDECDANAAAGPLPLDADFPSGDLLPPYHPNCVCVVSPVLPDPQKAALIGLLRKGESHEAEFPGGRQPAL
jgi:uncharacterized protein with gpF-like domain